MIYLLGQSAWPTFKTQALSQQLGDALGVSVALKAHELFVIHPQGSLDSSTLPDALLSVLDAKVFDLAATDPNQHALIAPRPGTETPWASRARDILKRCDLEEFGRIERFILLTVQGLNVSEIAPVANRFLYDRMTQVWVGVGEDLTPWVHRDGHVVRGVVSIDLGSNPLGTLSEQNQRLGLALSNDEMEYLVSIYQRMGRGPSDAELMMFAQANSEHCRHKIFNARWTLDGQALDDSLFGLIRKTHAAAPKHTIVAYDDNAAIIEGGPSNVLITTEDQPTYRVDIDTPYHIQIKVETHNHPTAISPDPGAATGSGGEIRDEAATGRGARPVAALTGFTVSDLHLPNGEKPWEHVVPPPSRLATPLEIMIEAPIGSARYNNEYGRPALLGYFRSFAAQVDGRSWGYHKPIMLAGGSGIIRGDQTKKTTLSPGDHIVVLGGEAMLIGLGGGAASSMGSGQSDENLDYASVQRGNPEMERRAQEVIDRCWAMGARNPIKAIHDVGAGGLSNAIPELLHDGGVGGHLSLAAIPTADPTMSPLMIWCNEAQERYVLGLADADLAGFLSLCEREQCPVASVGRATADQRLVLEDDRAGQAKASVIDMRLEDLLGKPPSMHRMATTVSSQPKDDGLAGVSLSNALESVLAHPTVGSKAFLIHIGDRSVGGLSVRDQMVGPYQVPVSDCAISLRDFEGDGGTAMAMGERTPLAIWNSAASVRMAIGEVLTNLAGVAIDEMSRIKLSANWMAAAGQPGQDAKLRGAVEAASEFAIALGLSIPVGKDSLSMHTQWTDAQQPDAVHQVSAPVSLIVSGFAPVASVKQHVTPELKREASSLLLVDFAPASGPRLGGSVLSQVLSQQEHHGLGDVPDAPAPEALANVLALCWRWVQDGRLLACHDRSDGGLFAAVFEMALAGHCGLSIQVPDGLSDEEVLAWLSNEELGVLLQVPKEEEAAVLADLSAHGLMDQVKHLGHLDIASMQTEHLAVERAGKVLFKKPMSKLTQIWSEVSSRIESLRDNPECAQEAFDQLGDWSRQGLWASLTFEPPTRPITPSDKEALARQVRPKVAILREQGVNGQREMAQSFMAAGFEAVDVTMTDLMAGRQSLSDYRGLVACGGFSYGDVLGAGLGWARSILFNPNLKAQFEDFLADPTRFALGVCNGCQMLSALKTMIPGASHWPAFRHNRSEQFEARLSLVSIDPSPSVFFRGMAGSVLPVVTAHGEGRAVFEGQTLDPMAVALRYVDSTGTPTERYPDNPNGSVGGITGVTNADGRVTILMPHPERLLRFENFSWAPDGWKGKSPWAKMFDNAREWVNESG